MEEIADYDCEILYKPGKENVVADALSRIHINALSPVTSQQVLNEIFNGYKEQTYVDLFMAVERGGGTTNRYTIQDQLLYYRTDEYEPWWLVLPNIPYRQRVVHENHNLAISGHPGFIQTYSKMARLYYCPGMSWDIRKHVQECDECQRTKHSTQAPAGVLEPLPISNWPWKSIGMDFLRPLPKSQNGNDMVLVIVDSLTKMAHFIATKLFITSSQVADLFVEHIFRYHGMPHSIVSDRDPKFTTKFWKNLNKSLGIDLLMSMAAHPQTDGQSEATVKVIQKLLRPFCLQEQDWEMLLPSLEFAYNDTQHSTTGYTPFYLNYGYHPTGTHQIEETNIPHVEDRIKYLVRLQEVARDAIRDAQSVQEKYANKYRRPAPEIKVDDWVLLRWKKEDKRKLAPIADGPFKVIAVWKNAVTLKFPRNTQAYPTVNISRVQLYFGPRPEKFTESPKDDTDHDYAVEKVLGRKVVNNQEYFYIHWKGYTAKDDSGEPRTNLSPETLQLWERTNQQRRLQHAPTWFEHNITDMQQPHSTHAWTPVSYHLFGLFSLSLNFYWLVLISRVPLFVSTLYGFRIILDFILALRPLWKIFTSEPIIDTYPSQTRVVQMSTSSSSSSSMVTVATIPQLIDTEQCRYIFPWHGIPEVQYQGWDLHYHPCTLHRDLFSRERQAITIRFCYRAFHENETSQRYIYRKHTFASAPRNIIFRQLDRNGQPQQTYISLWELYT
jgi:hypothetical protein